MHSACQKNKTRNCGRQELSHPFVYHECGILSPLAVDSFLGISSLGYPNPSLCAQRTCTKLRCHNVHLHYSQRVWGANMCANLPPAGQSPWGQKIGRPVLAFPGQHRDWGWRKGESVQMAGLWSGGGREREVGLGPAVKLDPNLASWANRSSLWLFPFTQN